MAQHRLLIIDYEPRGIKQLQDPLEAAGYQVKVAKDGVTGIKTFQAWKPDLTLIEAMLPKRHGFEVCQELKNTPHGLKTPIVIVTSVYKGRKYRTQALHHYGCNEYLEKPIDPAKLLEVVDKLLGSMPAAADAPMAAVATAETEIADRLDELMPDQADTSKSEKVVSFDPDRVRKRRNETGQVVTSPGPPGNASGQGLAAEPASPAPPTFDRAPEPVSVQIVEPETRPSFPALRDWRVWALLVLVAAIVFVSAIALM